jgi:hypothetical protein
MAWIRISQPERRVPRSASAPEHHHCISQGQSSRPKVDMRRSLISTLHWKNSRTPQAVRESPPEDARAMFHLNQGMGCYTCVLLSMEREIVWGLKVGRRGAEHVSSKSRHEMLHFRPALYGTWRLRCPILSYYPLTESPWRKSKRKGRATHILYAKQNIRSSHVHQ